ncbi:NADPH-dependent FMN reductase [Patulibacter americanus]|uniref:NADPH-dependent FMN reductase n=1 Tax=Patulibacter americanus TaxID=588672 RepID=UPI0003B5A5CB|nr:NAD(P)H-dependent oxidoreductase [Patulibacter americanus]
MPTLQIVIASTRPGRVGLPVGRWIEETARAHGGFDVEVTDLAELALPMMDEPHHPRLRRYEHDHTQAWSARVDAADAFVLVFPEYNHSYTAPLKNALDYLYGEWAHKPVGLVSYGGVSAGTRAAQQLKPVLTALSMTPLVPAVAIPFVWQHLQDGTFVPDDTLTGSAGAMLDELVRVEAALRSLRATV